MRRLVPDMSAGLRLNSGTPNRKRNVLSEEARRLAEIARAAGLGDSPDIALENHRAALDLHGAFVVSLTHDLKGVTSGITRGEGTLGQLVTNRQMYDQVNATLTRVSALMARLENPRMRQEPDPTLSVLAEMPSDGARLLVIDGSTSSIMTLPALGTVTIGRAPECELRLSDAAYPLTPTAICRASSAAEPLHPLPSPG